MMIKLPRLYHGTSTHYLSHFRVGQPISDLPLRSNLASLLTLIADGALRSSVKLEFYERNILEQKSGPANWQHGQLYASPALSTAVNYAVPNATYGGEALTIARSIIEKIGAVDSGLAGDIYGAAQDRGFSQLIMGGGLPIVVAIDGLTSEDVTAETARKLSDELQWIERYREHKHFATMCQQCNFRIAPDRGVVGDIAKLTVEKPDDFPFRGAISWAAAAKSA